MTSLAHETLDCEVLVIGSGPGGSVSACKLAQAGFDVLLCEEGPDARAANVAPYSSAEMDLKYRNAGLTPCIGKARVIYAEGRCLGGGSEVNSGFFHRTSETVLRSWEIPDLDLSNLEPHYVEIVERLRIGDVADAEGRTSQKLKAGADALGWTSEEVPRWIESHRDSHGNWRSKRAGMGSTYIEDAEQAGCRVLSGVAVDRLIIESGQAARARARKLDGYATVGRLDIRFRHVFVCAGAIGTPALLRRSGIKNHVGNSLQFHPMVRVVARFAEVINEGEFGVPVRQVLHFKPELTLGCSVSTPAHLALWMAGRGEDMTIEEIAPFTAVFYALVQSSTRGRIRPAPLLPEPLVFWDLTRADYARLADGLRKLAQLLYAAGAQEIMLPMAGLPPARSLAEIDAMLARILDVRPEATVIHLFASCPLGRDENAPLGCYGRSRQLANVFINDVSMLPGTTGVNPQATVMAVAMRNIQAFLSQRPRR